MVFQSLREYDSIDRMMDWIKDRPVRAKSHFKKSTKEIIDLLKQIEVALK